MRLIKFTTIFKASPVWINPEHITSVSIHSRRIRDTKAVEEIRIEETVLITLVGTGDEGCGECWNVSGDLDTVISAIMAT